MDNAAVTPSRLLSFADAYEEAMTVAVGEIRAGGLVVLPTDTVYGIAANAFDRNATRAIFRVKRRPRTLPLPVLVSRPRQAWALCSDVPAAATALAGAFWPGAVTIIVPANPELDWDLGDGDGSIAVRMPHRPELLALLERTGPLACTSANITGQPTPATVLEVRQQLGDDVGVYLDGGTSTLDHGSTIVDLSRGTPVIVRVGPISEEDVLAAIAAG